MTDLGNLTVMGPGESTMSRVIHPPSFENACDKLQWRNYVRWWAQGIQAGDKGDDSLSKVAAAALGLLLF